VAGTVIPDPDVLPAALCGWAEGWVSPESAGTPYGVSEPVNEPKQATPKGAEIPIPERREFLGNLEKIAPPAKPLRPADDDSAQQ
jgi:hypothetical protein